MVRIDYSKQSNCNVFVAYGQAMAEPFSKYLIRSLKNSVRRDVRNYIIAMIPEKVRKILGLILVIFGVVAMLVFWIGGLFFGLIEYEEISIIISIVGLFSIVFGIILLIHKDR